MTRVFFLVAGALTLTVAACGGKTDPPPAADGVTKPEPPEPEPEPEPEPKPEPEPEPRLGLRIEGVEPSSPERLIGLDGETHTRGDEGFATGIYRLPGEDGAAPLFAALAAGELTTVHVGDAPDNTIVVSGRAFPLDRPIRVVRMDEEGGLSHQKHDKQFRARRNADGDEIDKDNIEQVREVIHQVMLHTDLTDDARASHEARAARDLSGHFTIDFDGTIYQHLDVGLEAFHAGDQNRVSVAIDLNNRMPNLVRDKDAPAYNPNHPRFAEMQKHPRTRSKRMSINGAKVQSYGYTDAQYESLGALVRALTRILPGVERMFPFDARGDVIRTVFEDAPTFKGIIGHWHTSANRWDPGPGLDWARLWRLVSEAPRPGAAVRKEQADKLAKALELGEVTDFVFDPGENTNKAPSFAIVTTLTNRLDEETKFASGFIVVSDTSGKELRRWPHETSAALAPGGSIDIVGGNLAFDPDNAADVRLKTMKNEELRWSWVATRVELADGSELTPPER